MFKLWDRHETGRLPWAFLHQFPVRFPPQQLFWCSPQNWCPSVALSTVQSSDVRLWRVRDWCPLKRLPVLRCPVEQKCRPRTTSRRSWLWQLKWENMNFRMGYVSPMGRVKTQLVISADSFYPLSRIGACLRICSHRILIILVKLMAYFDK